MRRYPLLDRGIADRRRRLPLPGLPVHVGGAENVSMVFERAGLSIVQGEPKVYKAKPTSGGTFFCANCGVHVFSLPNSNPGLVAIKVGSLDDRSDFSVQADIWMKAAPSWHRSYEGARQVEGNLPG